MCGSLMVWYAALNICVIALITDIEYLWSSTNILPRVTPVAYRPSLLVFSPGSWTPLVWYIRCISFHIRVCFVCRILYRSQLIWKWYFSVWLLRSNFRHHRSHLFGYRTCWVLCWDKPYCVWTYNYVHIKYTRDEGVLWPAFPNLSMFIHFGFPMKFHHPASIRIWCGCCVSVYMFTPAPRWRTSLCGSFLLQCTLNLALLVFICCFLSVVISNCAIANMRVSLQDFAVILYGLYLSAHALPLCHDVLHANIPEIDFGRRKSLEFVMTFRVCCDMLRFPCSFRRVYYHIAYLEKRGRILKFVRAPTDVDTRYQLFCFFLFLCDLSEWCVSFVASIRLWRLTVSPCMLFYSASDTVAYVGCCNLRTPIAVRFLCCAVRNLIVVVEYWIETNPCADCPLSLCVFPFFVLRFDSFRVVSICRMVPIIALISKL